MAPAVGLGTRPRAKEKSEESTAAWPLFPIDLPTRGRFGLDGGDDVRGGTPRVPVTSYKRLENTTANDGSAYAIAA